MPAMKAWYAVRTRPRHELVTGSHLQRFDIPVFVPRVWRTRQWSDRRKRIASNLFPGYVFCRFRRSDFPLVRATPGVLHVVPVGCDPVAVSDNEIDNLREALSRGLHLRPVRNLALGKPVEVVSGPLAGLTGCLVRREKTSRLIISIDLLQQGVECDVHEEDVAPVHC